MQECPLCYNETAELLPIVNPGKQYQKCCLRCEQVATLITQNYPYHQGWFNDEFPFMRLIFVKNHLPFKIKNSIVLGEDGKDLLINLRNALTEILTDALHNIVAIDVVVVLARLFSDLSYTLRNQTVFSRVAMSAQKISDKQLNTGELAVKIDVLRTKVIFLQNLAIKYGSTNINDKHPTVNLIVELLSIVHLIDTLSTFEDALFYLEDFAGIAIIGGQPVPITAEGKPITSLDFTNSEMFDRAKDEAHDVTATKLDDVRKEFYEFSKFLDEPVLQAVNFTVSDLFNSYMAFANFAQRYDGIITLTPYEFNNLLAKILQTNDSGRIQAVTKYLQCTRSSALSAPYQVASFYSPMYVVPVGNYEMIVLNDSAIDFARSNFFHDLTYGSNLLFSTNENLQKEYNRLKQEHITAPFEEKTAEIFTKLGWKILLNVNRGIVFGKKVVAVVPDSVGEIDIVALSPDNKTLIVADCKYLFDYGATAKEIRSIRQKFMGKKSYFSQIERKKEWVSTKALEISRVLGNESGKPPIATKAVIITRNRAPLKNDSTTALVALYDLEQWIQELR